MHKKGLSDIVTTVLIILVAMVAVLIIWNFLSIFLNNSSIPTDSYSVSLRVAENSIIVDPTAQQVVARVSRGAGEGEIRGFVLGLTDASGKTVTSRYNGTVKELEQININVSYAGLSIGPIAKVSFTPVFFDSEKSKEATGNPIATLPVYFTKDPFPSGLMGRWTFDTDFRDNVGTTHGTPGSRALIDQTDKKVGGASVWLGGSDPDNVTIPMGPVTGGPSFTYTMWFRTRNPLPDNDFIMDLLEKYSNSAGQGFFLRHNLGNGGWFFTIGGPTPFSLNTAVFPLETGNWHFVAITFEPSNMSLKFDDKIWSRVPAGPYFPSNTPLSVGPSYNGSIDNLMIFNRALNARELDIIRTQYS